jgi:hypothetical protein
MDKVRFDSLSKTLASGLDRRQAAKGLGGLALGAVGVTVGARAAGAADNNNERDRKCKERCERRCENRDNPNRCNQKCRERRCDIG